MTDTPRTDELIDASKIRDWSPIPALQNLARSLERELGVVTEQRDQHAKSAGERWKALDAETQNHTITRRELAEANERIAWLESLQERTADGKIIAECENLYCPNCKRPVRQEFDICYCDECVNEDGGCWPYQPPLPLSYGLCLSSASLRAEASLGVSTQRE
jgi:hypothetical protein